MFGRFIARVRRARSKAAVYGAVGFGAGAGLTTLGVLISAASSAETARNEGYKVANCRTRYEGYLIRPVVICEPPERVRNVTAIANLLGDQAFDATWDLYFPSIPILGAGIGVILGGIYGFLLTPPSLAVPAVLPPPVGGVPLLNMDFEDEDVDLEREVTPPPAAPVAIHGAAAGIALALAADGKKISKEEVKPAEIKTMQQRYDEATEALEKACQELKVDVKKFKILKRYCCPISQELMDQPVIASNSSINTGRNYNQSHIRRWLEDYKNTDPQDRSRNIDRLTLNIDLQGEIKRFVEKVERQAKEKTAEAKEKREKEAQEKLQATPVSVTVDMSGASLTMPSSMQPQEAQAGIQPAVAVAVVGESRSGRHSPCLFPTPTATSAVSAVPAAAVAPLPATAPPRVDTSLAAATAERRQRPAR